MLTVESDRYQVGLRFNLAVIPSMVVPARVKFPPPVKKDGQMRQVGQLLVWLWLSVGSAGAGDTPPAGIYQRSVAAPVEPVYQAVYAALEKARFWVVFEADILANTQRFEQRWGEAFNPSQLTANRSLVVCNGWFANRVTGADPALAGLCPLRIGVTAKDGVTSVVFARPTLAARGSPGYEIVAEVEEMIIDAIDQGVSQVEAGL